MMIKFEIKYRWSGEVKFVAEIDCADDAPVSVKIGLAVRWAINGNADLRNADLRNADLRNADLSNADLRNADLRNADLRNADLRNADLRNADLSNADLSNADLSNADLSYADLRNTELRNANLSNADLSYADLRNADLSNADLRNADLIAFKSDFWMILTESRAEIPALISALKEGRVDGSTYSGDCACLVGTIANARGVDVDTLPKDSTRPAEQWFLMIQKGDKPGDETGGGFASQKALEWAEEYLTLTTDEGE